MKLIIVIILLVQLSCTKSKNQINENCILVEVANMTPRCGVSSVWIGMKFKKKNSDDVFVGLIHCPEVFGKIFFSTDKVYRVKATKQFTLPDTEVIHNEYAESGLQIYKIDDIQLR